MKAAAMILGGTILGLYMAGRLKIGRVDSRSGSQVMQHYKSILYASFKTGVPPELIAAVIWQETRGVSRPGAAGEIGLMQLKEIARKDLVLNGYDVPGSVPSGARDNVLMGAQFMELMKSGFDNWRDALRSYNAAGTNFSAVRNDRRLGSDYADSVLKTAALYGYREV